MPTCPDCQEAKPFRAFEAGAKLYPICHECRRRAADRLRKRKKVAFERGKAAAIGAAKARADKSAGVTKAKQEKRLKTRFNRLTASNRARLAVLERKCDKTDKTLAAIRARQALQRRYEHALARQLAMLKAGVPPGDLLDWLDE